MLSGILSIFKWPNDVYELKWISNKDSNEEKVEDFIYWKIDFIIAKEV